MANGPRTTLADFQAAYHDLKLFDEEAEMSVLGAMLLDRDTAMEMVERLRPEDFFKPANTEVFAAIRHRLMQNEPVDLVTVKEELERRGKLEEIGGYDTLATMMEATPVISNAPFYAKLVRKKAILRKLARACGDILQDLKRPGRDLDEILNHAQSLIFSISGENHRHRAQRMETIIDETFKDILDFRNQQDRSNRLLGLSTGLYEMDDMLCGLQKSHLYVLAGRPSMGKSSLGFRIIEHVAITAEKPVLLFSLEMSARQVCETMLCSLARVNSQDVRHGRIGEPHVKSLAIAAGKLSDARIWIDDSPDLNIFDLRNRARRLAYKEGISLIVVDYMQKVRAQPAESRQIEISLVSSQLKSMAKELQVPVIAAAQLNRAPEGREDKKPLLSDLRESGAIEQDADVVILMYRPERYRPDDEAVRGLCFLTVAKNRSGPTGDFQLAFLNPYARFENLRIGDRPST